MSSYTPCPAFTLPPLPTEAEENALEVSALHIVAVHRFRELSREALLTHPSTFESYHRFQVLTAACKSVERAAARAHLATGFPIEALDFTPVESMERYAPHLPAALEFVTAAYQSALPTVKAGGLIESLSLDAVRKAIQHEIAEAGTSA